jgi:hypothetical protein
LSIPPGGKAQLQQRFTESGRKPACYISNTQGGQITAAFFDNISGTLSKGCSSGFLKGFDTN